ncbi:MAG: methyl-accepting chemotaxis protein [Campylobacterota bacterium]|nr:methyl-accepting chemotaxis protein [Campylobacterota bacterium]
MINIEQQEYDRLKDIEAKYNKLKLNDSLDIANAMTNSAIALNSASKQKVIDIENISTLVNTFIEQSHSIEIKSKENFKSSESSSIESDNIIELVRELSTTINSLDSVFEIFSKTVDSLTLANQEISELVTINDKISFQTNLLSINAKIEASRAGEAGKGFSIVADEVKKLAASSKQSTEEIGKKITQISDMTISVKENSDMSNELIDNSVQIATDAIEKLKYLIELSAKNKDDSVEVQNIVNVQLKDSGNIKSKISELLDDTVDAITGSSKNIELGNSLLNSLK